MKYRSLNDKNHKVSFEDAVVRGLAPGKALYFPEDIPKLSQDFFQNLDKYDEAMPHYQKVIQIQPDFRI